MPANENPFTATNMRQQLLLGIHAHTKALLAAARHKRGEDEIARRKSAAQDSNARRLFVSGLRSTFQALRARFALARHGTMTGLQPLAVEVSAVGDAVSARAGRAAKPRRRPSRSTAPAAKPAGEKRQKTSPPRKRH